MPFCMEKLGVRYTTVWSDRLHGITYLFHDRRATANMGLYVWRDQLVTLQWSDLWDVISLQTLC